MSVSVAAARSKTAPIDERTADILVGKDVLELLTGAMYVDPLSIYREYIQNSCDAIDQARLAGDLDEKAPGKIEAFVDPDARSVRIRDNGIGVSAKDFVRRLTAIGASTKRGASYRGFRGVGRLSGLGYCQELVFRSRVKGDCAVQELMWNGRKLRDVLRSAEFTSLQDVVRGVTEFTIQSASGYPERFFEVELRKVVRLKNDILLNEEEVRNYLAQVAPVPFEPKFRLGNKIEDMLSRHGIRSDYEIRLNGTEHPIFRPFKNEFPISKIATDQFSDSREIVLKDVDGNVGAVGWILEHSYSGSIPRAALLGGLRLRSGNIQVGDRELLASHFPEPRFNGWSVGEFHVLDRRVMPNGRRDDFEQNAHYQNIEGQLKAIARELATTCRQRSIARNRRKSIEAVIATGHEILVALRSKTKPELFETIAAERLALIKATLERHMAFVERIGGERRDLDIDYVRRELTKFEASIKRLRLTPVRSAAKSAKRSFYEDVIRAVYELDTDIHRANRFVSRLVKQLKRKHRL